MLIRRKIFVLLMVLSLFSCAGVQTKPGVDQNAADLRNVALALKDVAISIGALQQFVKDTTTQGLLTADQGRPLMEVALKVSIAGQQATQATLKIGQLTPADRTSLLAVLNPMVDAVGNAMDQNIMPISNVKTRNDARTIFLMMQTALSTAQLVLASR